MKQSYYQRLKEIGYSEETLSWMTEEDCEAEYIELASGWGM